MVSGFTHAIIVIPAVGLRIGSSACPSHVPPSKCFALLDGSVGSRDPVVVIPVPASVVSVRPFPDESVRSSSRQYPIGESARTASAYALPGAVGAVGLIGALVAPAVPWELLAVTRTVRLVPSSAACRT
jgi:hypothetical protein